jgi:hypothetical protein
MAHILFATALAQALVAVIALASRLGSPANAPLKILARCSSSRYGSDRPCCFGKLRGSNLPQAQGPRFAGHISRHHKQPEVTP